MVWLLKHGFAYQNYSFCIYSEFSIKTIQWGWDKFYAASVGAGTARKENLSQSHVDI